MPMFMQKIVSLDDVLKNWTIMQDFVLIEDFGTPEYEVGSLISTAAMKAMPKIRFGKVLKTGPGQRKWSKVLRREIVLPLEVKPGDMVAYFKHHGTHTTYRTEDSLVLRLLDHRSQILAVVVEPPNGVASMAEWEAHLRKNAHWEMQI